MRSISTVLTALRIYFAIFNYSGQVEGDGCCDSDGICLKDPFVESGVISGEKVFLVPWDTKLRKGDWIYNLGFCRTHCAEMVTLQSAEEDAHFHQFIREALIIPPGVWLGAKIYNAGKSFRWGNEVKAAEYTNWHPSEPNGFGITSCLATEWITNNNKWWEHVCSSHLFIACQRNATDGFPSTATTLPSRPNV